MARLRRNFRSGTITDSPLLIGATSINSANFASLPVVTSPDVMALVLDPLGANGPPEIVYVTAHAEGATSVTATRGEEQTLGGYPARQHAAGTPWAQTATAVDLDRGPVVLGYAPKTSHQTGITSDTAITDLSVTVVVPAGRRIRVSAFLHVIATNADSPIQAKIKQDGTEVQFTQWAQPIASGRMELTPSVILSPTAGAHTYTITTVTVGAGTHDVQGWSTDPSFILVEDITSDPLPYAAQSVPVGALAYGVQLSNSAAFSAETDVPNCSVNVTVPAGRQLKITGHMSLSSVTVANDEWVLWLVVDGVKVKHDVQRAKNIGDAMSFECVAVVSPAAGAHTIKLTGQRTVGTGTAIMNSASDRAGFILVEDVTPTPASAQSAPGATLAYAEDATSPVTSGTTELELFSRVVTVTEGRRLKLSYHDGHLAAGTAGDTFLFRMYEDATVISTELAVFPPGSAEAGGINMFGVVSPSAGQHTYKVTVQRFVGTGTLSFDRGGSDVKSVFLVEDVTGTSVPVHDHTAAPSSTLAYAEAVATQAAITSEVDLTGLTATITVPAGRRIRVTAHALFNRTVGDGTVTMKIKEGATQLTQADEAQYGTDAATAHAEWVGSPSAGTHTYKMTMMRATGTGSVSMVASSTYPAFLLVEDITGVGVPGHTHTELDDTGWINLTLINNWVVYDNSYGPAGYSGLATAPLLRRKNGIVYLRGLIRSGTLGQVVAVLPVGFRPSIKYLFTTMGDSNVLNRYDVEPGGNVVNAAGGSNGFSALNGIIFPADG